jgi:cytoskeleton protein RodZ
VPSASASEAAGTANAAAAPAATASAAAETAAAAVAQTAASAAAPAASAATVAAEAKPAPLTATSGGGIAVFTTREASWVQVVDAAGLVHLRKTMDSGETVSINGTLPLSVVIGRANAIDVVVRGKPFDVQAVAKDNVARFQIK